MELSNATLTLKALVTNAMDNGTEVSPELLKALHTSYAVDAVAHQDKIDDLLVSCDRFIGRMNRHHG